MSTDASNPPLERVLSGEEVDMEPLEVRWLHTGSKHLALPTAPITGTETAYRPFSMDESHRIETAWEGLSDDRRLDIIAEWGVGDGEMSPEASSKGAYPTRKENKDKEKREKDGKVTSDPPTPGEPEEEVPPKDKEEVYKSIMEKARSDPSMLDAVHGVPVGQDSLFEVNIDTLSLHPVFWPQSGPRVPVIRGTWFVENETRPCSWDLAEELEKGYKQVEPWQPAYKDELLASRALGAQGDEKLKYDLPARFGGAAVVFEDASRCRLITSGTLDYLSRAIWSSFGSTTGSYVYRGYTAAAAAQAPMPMAPVVQSGNGEEPPEAKAQSLAKSGHSTPDAEKDDPLSKSEGQEVKAKAKSQKKEKWTPPPFSEVLGRAKREFDARQRSFEEQNAPVIRSHNDDKPCTDLVLAIHGIGQHLAAQYESLNFIYAANQFRQVLRKQSADPAAASVMKDRRVQLLPVQWRANLDIESGSAHEDAKKEEDNVFTFNDISLKQAIPQVREVTNSVLLDIPLFMSDHRRQMIEAVCQQANRLYRMWIARHPDFEEYGRVHVVGHSLGSALAAHILSNQPTLVPKVADLPKQALDTATDRFIFNTSNLFLCGSPLGIFLGLRQSHLLARLGRERTMNAQPDEAQLHPGTFGCMAVDSVYNIFYYTDPVAYGLNPTVDVRVAKKRPPLEIPSVTGSFFPSVALPTMPTMPTMPAMPSMPSLPDMSGVTKYLPFGGPSSKPKSNTPSVGAPSVHEDEDVNSAEVELSEAELLAGTRGERRFAALNPRGSIDFALPAQGLNDYLDMLTAHTNYWTDPNFSAFILNETFGPPEDKAGDDDAGKGQNGGDKASG